MRITCINTSHGLVPMYDDDFEEKKKLKVGEAYECEIKVTRNVKFHRKAFALLNAAWELMPEGRRNGFRSKEGFRDYLTVAAGFYNIYFNNRLNQFVETPKSWSFDRMDEAEFSDLYERMKDVVFIILGDRINEEIFNNVLSNF